jgi:hypothetical protein
MYEVVVSLAGLGLLAGFLLFDCRIRAEVTKSAETPHFSAWLLQQAYAVVRHCVSLSSFRRPSVVKPPRR